MGVNDDRQIDLLRQYSLTNAYIPSSLVHTSLDTFMNHICMLFHHAFPLPFPSSAALTPSRLNGVKTLLSRTYLAHVCGFVLYFPLFSIPFFLFRIRCFREAPFCAEARELGISRLGVLVPPLPASTAFLTLTYRFLLRLFELDRAWHGQCAAQSIWMFGVPAVSITNLSWFLTINTLLRPNFEMCALLSDHTHARIASVR